MTQLLGNSDSVPRRMLLDAAGRRVADLIAGPYDVSHLAPGVYLVYAPTNGGAVANRRLILLR